MSTSRRAAVESGRRAVRVPIPISMTRPPVVAVKMLIWMALSAPVHSKTTSKPSLASNMARAVVAASLALLTCSSEKVAGAGAGAAAAVAESLEAPLPFIETPFDLGVGDGVDEDGGEGKQ